jgi:hypothetical protein
VTADDGYCIEKVIDGKLTTKGWKLCVMEGWIHKLGGPEDLKESNPVEVAEYAVAQTCFRTRFAWWGVYIEAS